VSEQGSDVVVVGGGIVGAGAVYRLVRSGASVTLVDRHDLGYATGAGAGIISPGSSTLPAPAYPLAFAAVAAYPELLEHLAEDDETDTGYAVVGALFVASTDEEALQLSAVRDRARERVAQGMANIGEVRSLTGAEARDMYPPLGEVPAALHLSGAARLEARTLRHALLRAAGRRGLRHVSGSAVLLRQGDRVSAVQVNGEPISTGAVVLAAGAWTADLAAGLGVRVPIAPQRGQIAHLTMPETDTSAWPILAGFHSHYQLSFPDSRVVIGATRETGTGYDYRLTAAGVAEVLTEALRMSPGLGAGTVAELRIGFRPASPDHLPVLGLAPGYRNVYLAAGHGPSGLMLGPHSGALVADLILNRPHPLDLRPYAAERFQAE
jgi:D-amino-acid dehydrogenase